MEQEQQEDKANVKDRESELAVKNYDLVWYDKTLGYQER